MAGIESLEETGMLMLGCCRAGQGYSSSPEEPLCVPVCVCVCVRACMRACLRAPYMCLYVLCPCSFSCVCINIIASHPQDCCPVSLGPKACWLQQHYNILQRGLSSQFSSLIYCYSQQLSQPICKDEISEPQRKRKDFIQCQEKHHGA